MQVEFVILGICLFFAAITIAGLMRWLYRQGCKGLMPLIEEWGGPVRFRFAHACVYLAVERNRQKFFIGYSPQQKATPPCLYVTLAVPQRFSCGFRRCHAVDRIFSWLGLCPAIESNSQAFFEYIQVHAPDVRTAQKITRNCDVRDRIEHLIGHNNVSDIWMNRKGLSIIVTYELGQTVDSQAATYFMDELESISHPAEKCSFWASGKDHDIQTSPANPLLMRLSWAFVAMIIVGGMSWMIGTDEFPPLQPILFNVFFMTWPYMLGGIVCSLVAIWLITHRRTDRHLYMSILAAFSLSAWVVLCFGFVYLLNGLLARDELTQTERAEAVRIIRKGRGGKMIVFRVGGRETSELAQPGGNVQLGDAFTLHIKPGYFGFDWVDDISRP